MEKTLKKIMHLNKIYFILKETHGKDPNSKIKFKMLENRARHDLYKVLDDAGLGFKTPSIADKKDLTTLFIETIDSLNKK